MRDDIPAPVMSDGQVEEDILHDLHAHLTSILWIFTCGDT
jgi:hypothetical protein